MDQAIGSKIADYLIKPVNPTQILLTLKKNIHKKEIVTEVAQNAYQQNFGKIGMQINDSLTFEDWKEVYKRLVYWELELSETDSNMDEMLGMQKTEANLAFAKFIRKHYEDWIAHPEDLSLIHISTATGMLRTARSMRKRKSAGCRKQTNRVLQR